MHSQVKYEEKAISQIGEEFTPTQVKDAPSVQWNADASSFYTLAMVGKYKLRMMNIVSNLVFSLADENPT